MVKFEDFAKGPKDILDDDYTTKTFLKCKKPAGPVAVTIESERSKDGKISSKVGTKFAYAGLAFDKAQFKPDGSYALETSMKPYPGVSLLFKGGKGADVGLEYVKDKIFATSTVDVKDFSKLSSTASYALADGVKVGACATYALKGTAGLTAYDVGATYTSGPLYTSILSTSKMSQISAGVMYKVNDNLTLASVSLHSKAQPLEDITVGGIYSAPVGKIKAKVDKSGTVSACYIKSLAPKVSVTVSGSAPASDPSNIKYGLGILM